MWIEHAEDYGKVITWGTTGDLSIILEEAMRYANKGNYDITSIDTHIGNTYDEKLVTVYFE